MDKDKPWDMGHKPGYEFWKHQESAQQRGITREQFVDEHNNPDNYRPELSSTNRSRQLEDKTDAYFGALRVSPVSSLTADRRAVANAARTALGGQVSVAAYGDQTGAKTIDILTAHGSPVPDVAAYATIGLHEHHIGFTTEGQQLLVELVGAAYERFVDLPNILATGVFEVLDHDYTLYPGAVLRSVVAQYATGAAVKHLLLVSPFSWDGRLQRVTVDAGLVTWLQAVPITDAELLIAIQEGSGALERRLESEHVDVFDLQRPSAI